MDVVIVGKPYLFRKRDKKKPGAGADLGDAADRLGHEFTFVLWTSVSRGMFAAARATAAAGEPGWLAGVREMVTWAQRHGISLVNVGEVFDAANPMPLVSK